MVILPAKMQALSMEDPERELSVEIAATVAALEALRHDYARLETASANTSPFVLFEWHHSWCAHFLNLDPNVRDELLIYVLRDARADCVAIFPLVSSRRRFGPLQIVSIDLLGADPSTTETRTPLILSGYEEAAVRCIRAHLQRRPDWDWITWSGVADSFGRAIASGSGLAAQPHAPGYVLDLKASWEEFRAGLPRNVRESLRHCYNSLKRDGHSFVFEIGATPEATKRGIGRFLELHAMRAGMTGTVEHPDHFASAVARRFLFAVCERLAERGVVRIFQLAIGGEVVAVRIGFVVGDSLYLYYSGFDPAWARYGVMTTALAESLKYAISQRFKTVNLSRGTDRSKTRWAPRVVEYSGVRELRPRLTSRLAHYLYIRTRSGTGVWGWILRRFGHGRRVWDKPQSGLT